MVTLTYCFSAVKYQRENAKMVRISKAFEFSGVQIRQVKLYRKQYPRTKGNGNLGRVRGIYLGFEILK